MKCDGCGQQRTTDDLMNVGEGAEILFACFHCLSDEDKRKYFPERFEAAQNVRTRIPADFFGSPAQAGLGFSGELEETE